MTGELSCVSHRLLMLASVALLCWPGAANAEQEDDFRAELGGFYAYYSEQYGQWAGAQARFWLLDSTGERGHSGYINVIDLHWDPEINPSGSAIHSTFLLARYMRNWSKELYTMSTLGGTIDEPVFPRFQIEQEFNYIVPQHPVLVLAFGAGDRYYPSQNRPYLVFGGSYGLPKAGFSYRYWVGRGIAEKASSTHLLTWIYGDRLDFWLRLDLLWGDETHNVGLVHDAEVDSRGITLTVEKWLSRSFGFITTAEFTEMTLEIEEPIVLHRVQLGARAFITF